ncbi:hypothetical protein L6452_27660 [Arctium lappa]|uniref:Uncharacterized protein n=1 Tax=Arctium lappa TaxID=4217 RepID=A0ACB8ZWL2_ARCLA|nr:hypothetical protein L6452_27660 [Arctium lappa]
MRNTLRQPFLEEGMKNIFVHRIREMDIFKDLGVSDKPIEYQEEYARMMSWVRSPERVVKNKSGIVTVKQVRLVQFVHIWYSVFHVQRRDLSECTFFEADFCFLNVDDIEYLYHLFRNMIIRKDNILAALDAVKRFMRIQVNYTYCYDFQLGIETNQRKVNMKKLDLSLENIDDYNLFTVLDKLKLGVVYKTSENKKRFSRISEIAKFSDGTLKVINMQLERKLKENKEKLKHGEKGMGKLLKIRTERIVDAIYDRFNFRRGIRNFESLLGIRQGRLSRWEWPNIQT